MYSVDVPVHTAAFADPTKPEAQLGETEKVLTAKLVSVGGLPYPVRLAGLVQASKSIRAIV
jgi:hypothetical protein